METLNLENKLNNLLSISSISSNVDISKYNFYVGDYLSILDKQISQSAFFGKVAIFSFKETFCKLVKGVKEVLNRSKIISIDYIFDNDEKMTIETFSKMFNLPENLRAIIVFDSELSNFAGYFATARKIPIYYITCGLDTGAMIENLFYLKNDKALDLFNVSAKKIFVIDKELTNILNKSYATAFDYVVNNVISLIDKKINSFFEDDKINSSLFNLKNKAIINTFSIMKTSEKDRYDELVVNSATCGMINNACAFDYVSINSLTCCSLLLFKNGFVNYSLLLSFTEKILNFYKFLFKKDIQSLFIVKDYNKITEKLSKEMQIEEFQLLNNLLTQSNIIDGKISKINDFNNKFKDELETLANTIKKVGSIHTALSGEDYSAKITKQQLKEIIKYAGALSPKITGLSLLIHYGLTEIL